MEGKTQETAAAKAGMSVRSARNWQSGSPAVGDETGASVARAARPLRRGVGGGDRAAAAE